MRTRFAASGPVGTYVDVLPTVRSGQQVHGVRESPAAGSTAHRKSSVSEDGAGYVNDHPVERYYRGARITKIHDGTSEIRKNTIAEQLPREGYRQPASFDEKRYSMFERLG